MNKRIVVTGIGTGVGKTVVSAILCKALNAAYWKPIQTGFLSGNGDRDSRDVQQLSGCQVYPESYLLQEPLSPHAAAQIDGVRVETQQMLVPEHDGHLVIEGAGGLMVPLNDSELYIDVLEKWKFPVVLVSRHYLGSINHTLLTVEALKSRNIPIAGVVFIGDPLPQTVEAILDFSGLKVLLEIPELEVLNETAIHDWAEKLLALGALSGQ
jgi:dethiobiotin synthetase